MLKLKCGECRNFLPFEKSLNPKGGCSNDAIILDKDWEKSKGCRLEATAAKLYGKRVLKYNELDYPKEYLRQILQIDGSTANPQ